MNWITGLTTLIILAHLGFGYYSYRKKNYPDVVTSLLWVAVLCFLWYQTSLIGK